MDFIMYIWWPDNWHADDWHADNWHGGQLACGKLGVLLKYEMKRNDAK